MAAGCTKVRWWEAYEEGYSLHRQNSPCKLSRMIGRSSGRMLACLSSAKLLKTSEIPARRAESVTGLRPLQVVVIPFAVNPGGKGSGVVSEIRLFLCFSVLAETTPDPIGST